MSKLENALVWLYVKTWGKFGDHVINEKALWTFSGEDMRSAIMEVAYPRKRKFQETEKSEAVKALTELIMEKFENIAAFDEWSHEIHQDNYENLPEIPKQQETIKILKWDPGNLLYFIEYRSIFECLVKNQHIMHL